MTTHGQPTSGGQPSPIGFAIAAACATGLTAFITVSVISALRPPFGIVLANATITGFVVFFPYGWFYIYESRVTLNNLNELFRRMHSGDKEAMQRFCLLTFRMKQKWPESGHELVKRTLRARATLYFTLAWVLFVVIGIWVGQETARQQGRLIWGWRHIAWQWP